MLNNKGPSIEPCGTTAIIFIQFPRVLFIFIFNKSRIRLSKALEKSI